MFGGDDEDADFLSPSGGAKLASLFGLDKEGSQGNESFQYTAPKQPRKTSSPAAPANQKSAPPPGAPSVLLATAVQAFRYTNGQYAKQGKLGAAVLGCHATKEYKLLLYLSQQKQVAAAKIHAGFVLTVQPNNYCTFYDDQTQNWSLMFESEKAAADFCKEVCLAKANVAPSLDAVVIQDLSPGDGQAVENGDSLEVVYTGWILQNHTLGQMFDSNQNKDKLLRLKIGAGKVLKGWEEGMLGMKKSGRRLVVVPPSLAYGSKGVPSRVPADSTLVFEAELRRVKFSKDSGSDRTSASSRDSAAPSPAPSLDNVSPETPVQPPAAASGPGRPGEQPLRAKSNSLSEQLANPDATKAKLISRMARMGQPMFPLLPGGGGQPESSDSELEDSGGRAKDRPAAASPVQIASNHAPPHPHPSSSNAVLPVVAAFNPQPAGGQHAFQPYSAAPSQLQHVYPAQTVPYMGSGDVTSFLMTEARQHNTEIRLAVGKVADKVDQLASKVDDLQRQSSASVGVANMSMETSMIMHNIQRIIQENECLKKEVFDKSSRIEEQNRKIGDLINQNQRHLEQSHQLMEQRNDSLKSSSEQNQNRLLQAEQDKDAAGCGQVRLTEDLASSASRVCELQLEASVQQQKAAELQNKLTSALQDGEKQRQHVIALETQLEELKEAAERALTQHRLEKQRRKEMEARVSGAEEELQDLRTDKESLERTLSERKRKWVEERQRRDEEVEELRRSSQQEVDNVRAQLRRARSSNNSAASDQLSQLQEELEEEWRKKSEQMLSSAREQQARETAEVKGQHDREMAEVKDQHDREMAEVKGQRDALLEKLGQLQQESSAKASLGADRQQHDELQSLQERCAALEREGASEKERLERRVEELEKNEGMERSGETAAEVKRVMNGVFRSLRGEFDVSESYSGGAVLSVIVSTIKDVTLQLLSGAETERKEEEKKEEEEKEEEEGGEEVNRMQHVNGEREEEEEEHVKERIAKEAKEEELRPPPAGEKEEEEEERKAEEEEEERKTEEEEEESKAEEEEEERKAEEEEKKKENCLISETTAEQTQNQQNPEPETREEEEKKEEEKEEEEVRAAVKEEEEEKSFLPPANPPPPPPPPAEPSSLTGGGTGEENGEEPFFQKVSPAKAPPTPAKEEEEDELSLKGRPPPAPLFTEEDDDEDLDWLN